MTPSTCWRRLRLPALVLALLLGVSLAGRAQPGCPCDGPRCLEDLRGLSGEQLHELFTRAEIGRPLLGVARGRLLYLTDPKFPRLKVRLANMVWRGKAVQEDGYFTNRWIGNVNWIDSHWAIGPSWVDGRPAVVMEYAPGTPLFEPMHDEIREIAPGLYMGPVYERFPCVKFRGYVGLQLEACEPRKGFRPCR